MSFGSYLREIREAKEFTLRDVEKLAKEMKIGAELSSGYLSMLEKDKVKTPAPRILYALSKVYEIEYIDVMKKVGYIPENVNLVSNAKPTFAFRGANHLDDNQKEHIQKIIDFELNQAKKERRIQPH